MKLIDFGTSVKFNKKQPGKISGILGTSYYIAPEVLRDEYDERCDVWSIGVVLYILLSGKAPFDAKTDEDIIKAILKGEYSMDEPIWEEISDDAKSLIKRMM